MIPEAAQVPPGRWAVAVSGGADSVALFLLLHCRPNLFLHIVHLDHQTRGQASAGDARFVGDLAKQLDLPVTIARRDQIEPQMQSLPKNLSARFRALRIELFRRTVASENLLGVILGHQADDQAETIFLRLLRNSGPAGLSGMSARRRLGELTLLRPLLHIRRADLRSFLAARGQNWREDASNQSEHYARNRIRRFLESRPDLHEPLLAVGRACAEYSKWIGKAAPTLNERFPAIALAESPRVLARESARRWLTSQGVPPAKLTPAMLDRLRDLAADAATPAKQQFPADVRVHRRSGWISREK
ncbi:MAG: tRNA lysidine(34) synthetase TilS [Tepidisphaeraceae bacterium]